MLGRGVFAAKHRHLRVKSSKTDGQGPKAVTVGAGIADEVQARALARPRRLKTEGVARPRSAFCPPRLPARAGNPRFTILVVSISRDSAANAVT